MRLIRYVLLLAFFTMFAVMPVFAQSEGASLDERGYGLYIPTSYDEDGDDVLPLVIALHGFGDTWENFYPATGLIPLAESENFIVSFAQAHLREWNDGRSGSHDEDDVQLLQDLITRIDRDYRIDLERVYLVGFSNGGSMVFQAVCQAPDVFAGVVSIAGSMLHLHSDACETVQTPVLFIHSMADNVVPFEGTGSRLEVTDATSYWVNANECDISNVDPYDPDAFRNGFQNYFFDNCPNGNLVMLHILEALPHMYPGGVEYFTEETPAPQFDTARLIWGFFDIAYTVQQDDAANAEVTPEATEAAD